MADEYLIRVGKNVSKDTQKLLELDDAPSHVRFATLSPLSTYGYLEGVEVDLLKISDRGLVMGVDGRAEVPHEFIPWQNVSYVCDGSELYKKRQAARG